MTCGIYEFWCGPYFYQGSSRNIEERWKAHTRALKAARHQNDRVQAAYDKYGWTDAGILVECEEYALIAWEQAYIDTNWGDEKYLNLNRRVLPHYKRRAAVRHELVLALYGFVW